MTALKALAILESAVLECKKRDINTPEVKNALDLLERYSWPKWLVLQFRHHALKERTRDQVGGATASASRHFPGIRDCVRELLRVQMDRLALKFHKTKDLKISDEIYRLAGEYGKLKEPWVFRP